MPVPPRHCDCFAISGRQAVAFPLCPNASKLAGISNTRSAVDMPSAPLSRCVTPGQSTTNQLRPPHPLLPQRGGVMMVPSITSDGLEAPIRGAMMTASSFSCRMGNLCIPSRRHIEALPLAGLRPVSCRHSDCLRSEVIVAVDPLITADCCHRVNTFFLTRRVMGWFAR